MFLLLQPLKIMLCLLEGIQLIVTQDPLVKVLQNMALQ